MHTCSPAPEAGDPSDTSSTTSSRRNVTALGLGPAADAPPLPPVLPATLPDAAGAACAAALDPPPPLTLSPPAISTSMAAPQIPPASCGTGVGDIDVTGEVMEAGSEVVSMGHVLVLCGSCPLDASEGRGCEGS